MASAFTLRPATLDGSDTEFLGLCFNSQLPWLAEVGSGGQWGDHPRGSDPKFISKMKAWIDRSQNSSRGSFNDRWCKVVIAEATINLKDASAEVLALLPDAEGEQDRTVQLPVAALVLEDKASDYISPELLKQDEDDPFVFLTYLISDRRVGKHAKGAVPMLLEHAKEEVRALGLHRLCVDCWSGNERRLVRYYESQGFRGLGDFIAEQWPGTVLEMRL